MTRYAVKGNGKHIPRCARAKTAIPSSSHSASSRSTWRRLAREFGDCGNPSQEAEHVACDRVNVGGGSSLSGWSADNERTLKVGSLCGSPARGMTKCCRDLLSVGNIGRCAEGLATRSCQAAISSRNACKLNGEIATRPLRLAAQEQKINVINGFWR